MEQTSYYDLLRIHIEDKQIELGYSFTFSDFFYVLDRLSVLSCVSRLRNKEILSNNPDFNYVFDYSWNKFDSFLCEKNKHQLLLDISAAYGWDLIADGAEAIVLNALSMFITIDCLYELISSNRTNSQYSELYSIWKMPVEERFQACYDTCEDSYCDINMYEYYPSKAFIKENLRSETMEFAKKVLISYYKISVSDDAMFRLLSMDLLPWLSSITILHTKIHNPEFSPSDTFFEELNYFNAFDIYNVSPMFTCNDDAFLILTFPEFDDTEYRISDTVDYGYLNPDGFRLFNNFYLKNQN